MSRVLASSSFEAFLGVSSEKRLAFDYCSGHTFLLPLFIKY